MIGNELDIHFCMTNQIITANLNMTLYIYNQSNNFTSNLNMFWRPIPGDDYKGNNPSPCLLQGRTLRHLSSYYFSSTLMWHQSSTLGWSMYHLLGLVCCQEPVTLPVLERKYSHLIR